MITIKIILIEITLVVITTAPNNSTNGNLCEDLIHSTNFFESDVSTMGFLNYMTAFNHLTLQDIKHFNDSIPESSDVKIMKRKLKIVTVGYFGHLISAAYANPALLNFLYPEFWCSNKVNDLRSTGALDRSYSWHDQVNRCYDYIVPEMFKQEGYFDMNSEKYRQHGKKFIINALYVNWSVEKIQAIKILRDSLPDPLRELPGAFTGIYTLGYFNYVSSFAIDINHDPSLFNSITQYCYLEGDNLIND